jgi:AcrR family transcriptional regulator
MKSAKPAVSTKDRILDAAERLFADAGYDGVSLRQITRAAGVELALANYHFGPKSELFVAVVRRRAEELNRERMTLIAALPEPPTVEGLIDAFGRPFMEKSLHGGAGWKSYARLIAHIANSERWTQAVMTAHFDAVAEAFIAGAKRALPGADVRNLYWAFHFMLGAMTMTFAETGRIDVLSRGRCRSRALDEIFARLVPFLAAGFRHLAEK